MKQKLLLLLLLCLMAAKGPAQEINGEILQDKHNLTVIRVWGTHEERGFAAGYLLAPKIEDIMQTYVHPAFGPYLPTAKWVIQQPQFFVINPEYIAEAKAMAEGVKAAGYMPGIDYLDVLLGNCFLDFSNLALGKSQVEPPGCSSLLSWGSATHRTDVRGKAMITRHMDWTVVPPLVRNQVMVIHIPSEKDEQPWLLIGFAAQMSVLSGTNRSGLTLMHHMMNDEHTPGTPGKSYNPIWFAMREILEKKDINGDHKNDVQDVVSYFSNDFNGVADGFIISALARSHPGDCRRFALIAELAPCDPEVTFRYQSPDDQIPGDNLYTANYQIGRNEAMNICPRYEGIMEHIGEGTGIGKQESWELMQLYSFLEPRNLNAIQVVPEDHYLRVAVHQNEGPAAALAPSLEFNTNKLFRPVATALTHGSKPLPEKQTQGHHEPPANLPVPDDFMVFPNPSSGQVHVAIPDAAEGKIRMELFNLAGQQIYLREYQQQGGTFIETLDVSSLEDGLYILVVHTGNSKMKKQISLLK